MVTTASSGGSRRRPQPHVVFKSFLWYVLTLSCCSEMIEVAEEVTVVVLYPLLFFFFSSYLKERSEQVKGLSFFFPLLYAIRVRELAIVLLLFVKYDIDPGTGSDKTKLLEQYSYRKSPFLKIRLLSLLRCRKFGERSWRYQRHCSVVELAIIVVYLPQVEASGSKSQTNVACYKTCASCD